MCVKLNVHKPRFARPGVCEPGAKRVLILLVTTPRKAKVCVDSRLQTANGQLAKYPPVVTSKYERSPLYLQCRIYGRGQYHGDISSQGVVDMTGMNGGCRYHDYRISRIT